MIRYDAYAHLSEENRLDRFCAIMAKAVYLAEQRDQEKRRNEARDEKPEDPRSDAPKLSQIEAPAPVSDKIIHFLSEVGEASPQDIQHKHDLSRSKTYRLLVELKQNGKVEQFGRTRSIRYRLVS